MGEKLKMKIIGYEEVKNYIKGKSVAIIGSGPSCLDNEGKFIDSFDLICRINNYKINGFENKVGSRTDIYYSFFGGSIRKTKEELLADGVKILMAKCPNSKFIESEWHTRRGKENGIDFRPIYRRRASWFFKDIYVPTTERFLEYFNLLGGHIPTTGFSCILDFLSFPCRYIYITGFDFFRSGIHNVDERWTARNNTDPIGHVPETELEYLKKLEKLNVIFDKNLTRLINA